MRHPIRLTVADDLRRGHGSVFFRAWLAVPLLLWLALWSIAAIFVAFGAWVTALILGRTAETPHRFLTRYVRYTTHVYAYLNLTAEPLPSFDGKPGYPIDVEIDAPADQNRWSVAFRAILALPGALVMGVLVGSGTGGFNSFSSSGFFSGVSALGAAAFLGWFYAVARGRMPCGLRDLSAYSLAYGAQFWGYFLLLTDRYPSSDPLTAIGPLPVRAADRAPHTWQGWAGAPGGRAGCPLRPDRPATADGSVVERRLSSRGGRGGLVLSAGHTRTRGDTQPVPNTRHHQPCGSGPAGVVLWARREPPDDHAADRDDVCVGSVVSPRRVTRCRSAQRCLRDPPDGRSRASC